MKHALSLLVLCATFATPASAQLEILNYHDTDALAGSTAQPTANFVRDAATAIGANLTVVPTRASFNTTFDMGGWDVVICSSWSGVSAASYDATNFDRMATFVASGGKVIVNGWTLQNFASHPFFTTTVPVTFGSTYTSLQPLYPWDPTHAIWTTPNPVSPTPLTLGMAYTYNVDGQFATPGAGSVAVGGYAGPTATPNNAGIIVGPSGNAIVNTFTPQQYTMATMVDLYVNEILYNLSSSSCAISSPAAGAMLGGDVDLVFDGDDTEGDPIDSVFEFSLDGGLTWNNCTPAATSLLANPDLVRATPFSSVTFVWNSLVDGVGTITPASTDLRITVTDGTHVGSCSILGITVDNVVPPPVCTAMVPPGTLIGEIDVTVDGASPSTPTVDVLIEWSADGGATFSPASMAASSANPNPATGIAPGGAVFTWDSRGDGVAPGGPVAGVIVRATVTDSISPGAGTCQTLCTIDNSMICGGICGDCNLGGTGPDILDALTAAQIAVGLTMPSVVQEACCDVNSSMGVDVVDALLMAQSSAGLPAVLVCP